jgi:hypothetical protein
MIIMRKLAGTKWDVNENIFLFIKEMYAHILNMDLARG